MKIDALRIAAFRRFSDPAAIEDFTDGVNVLAGPNEMGKSTFFHALEAAFLVRHKVSGIVLDGMRPFAGGDPLVEADFSDDGRRWRIRKQFGRGNSAVLSDLGTGRIVARNAEAEDQLGQLIGRPGDTPGPLGLVWVRQQRTLHAPDPDIDHVTGKEKPRGEKSALQEAIGHEVQSAAGGEAVAGIRQRTQAALDQHLTPTRNGARKNGPLDLARRQREETVARLELAQRAATAAENRLEAIAKYAAELAALAAPLNVSARQQSLETLEREMAAEVKRRADYDVAREALKARDSEADAARQKRAAEQARAERHSALIARRAEAVALEAEISRLAAVVNADGATRLRIDHLAALERDHEIASAELAGDAARVEIALEPGGAGRVHIADELVVGVARRDVPEHLDIQIEGIANIRVTSAGAERAAAARLRRDRAAIEIAAALAAIGASNGVAAREKAEARSRSVVELDRCRAKLSGVAPRGSVGISAELSAIASGDATTGANRSSASDALEASVRDREAAAHVARVHYDTLKANVISDDGFRQLAVRLDVARRDEKAALQKIADLKMRVENLKSEQAGADEDGRAGQVEALKGEFERHDAEVKRLEAECKALLLLARTLDDIEVKARDAFFEPVTRRLQPYLNDVFGAASLGFRDAFAIDGLTRDGLRQDFAVLSDGTREQLSVLVRLGFAEVLAARGVAVPLVLDDPLVYSDDDRLSKVCRVLETASRQLQVIVLTCRPTAFQSLSGHRLTVSAWRPDRA